MLVELAIGDAYGAGFEFAPDEFVATHNTLSAYVQHPRYTQKPGSYTDDTQMSLAIAETLIANDPWTPEVLASRFVTAFKRDPRQGYASRFYEFLLSVNDGKEFLAKIQGTSDKSGSAMRVTPVGILPTIEQVIEAATIQAKLTHNSPNGINAAIAAALMSHYFLYRLGNKEELGSFLERYIPGSWSIPWNQKVSTLGWQCVQAAVTAIVRNDSLSDILQDCVAFTGDVDTVAAIALAAASCSQEVNLDLPLGLFEGLENGRYGRDYMIELDRKLLSRVF